MERFEEMCCGAGKEAGRTADDVVVPGLNGRDDQGDVPVEDREARDDRRRCHGS